MTDSAKQAPFVPSPKGLNVHGFGFHYAVIKLLDQLHIREHFGWQFIGAEVPISLNGQETHADLILYCSRKRTYLIGECKRPDPSLANWCFAQSLYSIGYNAPVTIDELYFPPGSGSLHLRPRIFDSRSGYQVGVSIKHPTKKGEGCASDRDAIAKCVGQVFLAANGFIDICAKHPDLVRSSSGDSAVRFVPAIFTTAELTSSDDDLSTADLASGNLPDTLTFSEKKFLWYQYGLNSSLHAPVPGRWIVEEMRDWRGYFRRSAVRSVGVVNVHGIEEFLDELDRVLPSF